LLDYVLPLQRDQGSSRADPHSLSGESDLMLVSLVLFGPEIGAIYAEDVEAFEKGEIIEYVSVHAGFTYTC
jgi:hypothetical protein